MTEKHNNTAAFFEEQRRNTPACCRCGDHLGPPLYHWNTPPHCWRCESSARAIRKARAKWGDRFDFTKEEEKPRFFDMVITCNRCRSEFKTTIIKLLDSPQGGCKECQRLARANAFKEAAEQRHGKGRYIYDLSEYRSLTRIMIIKCLTHGPFTATGKDHVKNGKGCPECAPIIENGWSRSDFIARCEYNNNGQAYFYLIHCHRPNEPAFLKMGITSQGLKVRFNNGNMPYNFEPILVLKGNAAAVYDLERALLRLNKPLAYEPRIIFGGYTECFRALNEPTAAVLGLN